MCIGNNSSANQALNYGIPQGSVVGPLFFVLYTCCFGTIIQKYPDIEYHEYADDLQLYITFDPKEDGALQMAIDRLANCVSEISVCMRMNLLKLNDDKTEFFIACSSYNAKYINDDITIRIGNSTIPLSSKIKNLGVLFDSSMSMTEHVKSIVKSVNFHLRNINRIRRYITQDSCHHLVRSLVLQRIDYANSTLYGITVKDSQKLQRLQNRAARIVFRQHRMHPSAPLLKQLHWLPVDSRIIFKLMLLTFKRFHGLLPSYLSDLLPVYVPGRPNLRSGDDGLLLHVPRTHLAAGDKCFSTAAPSIWNSLPIRIRQCTSTTSFKKALKTHLFPKD